MFRALLLALPMVLGLAVQAVAFDPAAMTDAEREAFRAEVRAYLLENPEVLVEAIDVLDSRRQASQEGTDRELVATHAEEIFADGRSWVGGNPDGDVTVVEFMDYRCPYCKQALPEVDRLLSTDGNIRYIVKELPILGEQSVLGARFAIAVREVAGADAYGRIHQALMEMRGEISDTSLRALAQAQGLDPEAIEAAMAAPAVDEEIAANYALAKALQITGTPGFVFGDQLVRGYVPYDAMIGIVAGLRG